MWVHAEIKSVLLYVPMEEIQEHKWFQRTAHIAGAEHSINDLVTGASLKALRDRPGCHAEVLSVSE
jgi:hypothetical protein